MRLRKTLNEIINETTQQCGCDDCASNNFKVHDTESFIKKAKLVHGDKYDYSQVNYINSKEHVTIVCPKHGLFPQEANSHLNGHGCKDCYKERTKELQRDTVDEFIIKARNVHGDKYDYSLVDYVNQNTNIIIVCPKHGNFDQAPSSHLAGRGCKLCAREKLHNERSMGVNEFIKCAREIHGDKYDYSQVEYYNYETKVNVICHKKDIVGKEHGVFPVTPHHHIGKMRSGCPKCSGCYHYNTEEIIELFKAVHKDDYIYDLVDYKTTHTPVTIICKKHGTFPQAPDAHLQGQGCPFCKETRHHSEYKVYEAIKKMFPDTIHHYRPDFLKTNKKGKQEIDTYIPSLKIGIEYQGIQHFKSMDWCGGEKSFENLKQLDERKYNLCKQEGIKLFYVSFEKDLPETYFDKIYTNVENLINEMKNMNTT